MSVFTTQLDNILVDNSLTLSFISEENKFVGCTPLLYCSGYLLGRIVIPNVKFVYQLSGNDKFGNPFVYTMRSSTSRLTIPSTILSTDPPTISTDIPTTSSTDTSTTPSTTDTPTTSSTDTPTTSSTDTPTPTSSTEMPTTPPTKNPYVLENVFDGSANKSVNIGSKASVYFGLKSTGDTTSVLSFNILVNTSPTELMLKIYKANITVKPNDTEIIIVTIETKDTDTPGSYMVTITATSGDLILTNSQNITLVDVSVSNNNNISEDSICLATYT